MSTTEWVLCALLALFSVCALICAVLVWRADVLAARAVESTPFWAWVDERAEPSEHDDDAV